MKINSVHKSHHDDGSLPRPKGGDRSAPTTPAVGTPDPERARPGAGKSQPKK